MAVSFAKAGAKGIVIVDILDDATLAAAAKDIESHGATVCRQGPQCMINHDKIIATNPLVIVPRHSSRHLERKGRRQRNHPDGGEVWAYRLCGVRYQQSHLVFKTDHPACSNFAGITGQGTLITDMSLGSFNKVMDVNCTGLFLCNKYQLRQMMQQSPLEV